MVVRKGPLHSLQTTQVGEGEEDYHQEGALQGGEEVPEDVLYLVQGQQAREVGTYMLEEDSSHINMAVEQFLEGVADRLDSSEGMAGRAGDAAW